MAERFETDCLIVLEYLDQEKYTGLKDMEEETGLSKDELRRYMLPEVKEKRPVSKLEEWAPKRNGGGGKNPYLYAKIIENAVYLGKIDGEEMVQINTSKHEFLRHYARKYNYRIMSVPTYPYITVVKKSKIEQKQEYGELSKEGRIDNEDPMERSSSPEDGRFSPLL